MKHVDSQAPTWADRVSEGSQVKAPAEGARRNTPRLDHGRHLREDRRCHPGHDTTSATVRTIVVPLLCALQFDSLPLVARRSCTPDTSLR